MQLTLTQEQLQYFNVHSGWTDVALGHNFNNAQFITCVGFIPLPATVGSNDIMNFFINNPADTNDRLTTGNLVSYLPHKFMSWQKEKSMLPEPMNPTFIQNGITEGKMLDQSTINGFFNRITNYIHGLYTKAATQANVITSLLTNTQRLAERMTQNEVGLQTVLNVDLVGGIMQCVGTLDPNNPASQLYQLCDGSPILQPAARDKCGDTLTEDQIENGAFYRINYMMWEMGKGMGNTGENWDEFNAFHPYNVPDLRGYFLVGADHQEATKLYARGGEREVVLGNGELPLHSHQVDIHESRNVGIGGTDVGAGQPSDTGRNTGWLNSDKIGEWDMIYPTQKTGNTNASNATAYEQTTSTAIKGHNNMPPYFAINYYIRILK